MTHTFLVTLNMSSYSGSPDGAASDILESLTIDGLPVTEVKPWQSHGVDTADTPLTDMFRTKTPS